MDFIWYYPKSNGLNQCLEYFNDTFLTSLLNDLNKYYLPLLIFNTHIYLSILI